jgi:hypothetical protein
VLNFFVTAVLLNSVLAWLGRHTAARALGEPRRDGAYELLLTTPLLPADIVWGTLEALRTRFRLLAHVVFLLNAAMMLGGLVTRPWSPPALMVYFCVWLVLLTWTWNLGRNWQRALPVMWASLNCGRPLLAVWRTSGFNSWSSLGSFTWIWILYNLPKQGFRRFPTGSLGEIVVGVFIVVVWLSMRGARHVQGMVTNRHIQDMEWDAEAKTWRLRAHAGRIMNPLEQRLIREFREIVREPLPDPNDPRFKRWNVQGRFPWGWEMVQQQLHERLTRK